MTRAKLSVRQSEAVKVCDRDVVVVAGAGAGKTRVLTEFYIQRLSSGAGLDEVVAVTFTDKAAQEMRERVRKAIALEVAGSGGNKATFWQGIDRRLGNARISTINGFCTRLLKEFPVEAGVDPDFTLFPERQARELLSGLARELVLRALDAGGEAIAGLVRLAPPDEVADLVLEKVYDRIRGSGMTAVQALERTLRGVEASRSSIPEIMARVDALLELLLGLEERVRNPKRRDGIRNLFREWAELTRPWSDPSSPKAAAASSLAQRVKRWLPKNCERLIKDPVAELHECIDELVSACADVDSLPYVQLILGLVEEMEKRYQAVKRAASALDYTDQIILVRNLLRDNGEVRQEVARRVRFLLIDEFQDTDPVQEEVIELLRTCPGDQAGPLVFVVGDPRQSIYRFRGADVDVFHRALNRAGENGGEVVHLNENFRTNARLLSLIQTVFDGLRADGLAGWHIEAPPDQPQRKAAPAGPVCELLFARSARDDAAGRRRAEAAAVARRIRAMVEGGEALVWEKAADSEGGGEKDQEKPRPVRYSDIAILFRTMKHAGIYEEALRQEGIDYCSSSGTGFGARPEVRDMVNLLRVLEDPRDGVALAAVLRSPMFGLSDEALFWLGRGGRLAASFFSGDSGEAPEGMAEDDRVLLDRARRIIRHLRYRRHRLSISGLLEEAIEATGYMPVLMARRDGQRCVANLRKLVNLATEFEAGQAGLIPEFIRVIRTTAQDDAEASFEDEAAEAVRLLTVHKAKGLEFPVVFLADTSRDLETESASMFFDRCRGLGITLPLPARPMDDLGGDPKGCPPGVKTGILKRNLEEENRLLLQEEVRVLYVALTRARDYLVIAGAGGGEGAGDRTWLAWLMKGLGVRFDGNGLPVAPPDLPVAVNCVSVGTDSGGSEAPGMGGIGGGLGGSGAVCLVCPEVMAWAPGPLIQPLEPSPPLLTSWSVTEIAAFVRCPRRYFFDYILRLPSLASSPLRGKANPVSAMPALLRGQVIHRVCQMLKPGAMPERLLKDALLEFGLAEVEDGLSQGLLDVISRWQRSPLYQKMCSAEWVESEQPFGFLLENQLIRGQIDKAWGCGRKAVVLDFKTDDIDASQVNRAARDYLLQMQAYMLAAREALGWEPERCHLFFLVPGIPWSLQVTGAILDDARQSVQDAVESLAQARRVGTPEAFPPNSGDHCRRCPRFPLCRRELEGHAAAGG